MRNQLSLEHIAALERRRRIIVNFDVISGDRTFANRDLDDLVEWKFNFIDDERTQIDSVWWCWGEGHQAPWPSKTMPLYDDPGYRTWVEEGVDIVKIFLDAAKERGIEAFYNYRINGSDNDLGPVADIPMKMEHPDWLIPAPWQPKGGYFDFTVREVREYKLGVLREIAERYDCDGISLDFARTSVVLPTGHQWENRESLTEFMREFRAMTLEAARNRGRPMLVGARVPENLMGCHFDGIDVETWAREQLVDIFAVGVRSFDVDIEAFRRITEGTHINLYPSIDDHHASDGYQMAPIEVYRGAAANWWQQGADGMQTFNFNHAVDFPYGSPAAKTHLLAYQEIGSAATLKHKDKVFVVQRRGGGHGPSVVPNPEDWHTPRLMYFNTNMFAPLPAALDNRGKADTLLTVRVADNLAEDAGSIKNLTLRVLLSDPAAVGLPEQQAIGRAIIRGFGGPDSLYSLPPAEDIVDRVEVRLNDALLAPPSVQDGWLVFIPDARQFAVGNNLVGLRVTGRPAEARDQISVEKLEVHVRYR